MEKEEIKRQLDSYLRELEYISFSQGEQKEEYYDELQKVIEELKKEIINYVMDKIN